MVQIMKLVVRNGTNYSTTVAMKKKLDLKNGGARVMHLYHLTCVMPVHFLVVRELGVIIGPRSRIILVIFVTDKLLQFVYTKSRLALDICLCKHVLIGFAGIYDTGRDIFGVL